MKANFLQRRWASLSALVFAFCLAGCATVIPGASRGLLAFLQPGSTTRQEVVLALGQPSATLEQERILTYRIGEDPRQGYYVITAKALMPWEAVRHSLVLVFDVEGVLQQHRLVAVQ
ncbi:MAG TPA: hypothetical protein VLD18_03940 [Verrucomicrobiae bacterium]|nr:hypothetical protein [Verrucomicrobiae bacterium]